MKTAFLFPGQGAQYVGMGKDFYDSFQIARETFQEADRILGVELSKIIFEGPNEKLTETLNAQLGIFVTSVAILRVIQEERPELKPTICSGLSLGEYTALYASGRLDFKETLLLVRERARLMNDACENTKGTMAAVLGLSAFEIGQAVKDLKSVWVANYNAPGQTVISGTIEGVDHASLVLKEKGARRIIPLSVHGAFHSALMQSAQDGLAPFVQGAPIQESEIEFVMNVPGDKVSSQEEIRKNLIAQVTQSVCWEQGMQAMKDVDLFFEIGPGKTLSGLCKKMGITNITSIDKISDLELAHAIT